MQCPQSVPANISGLISQGARKMEKELIVTMFGSSRPRENDAEYGEARLLGRLLANAWVDVEVRVATWQERLFELIRLADGFVACKGGTGTLAELAVAWEMMNKSVMAAKPLVALGEFWQPIIKSVREVEAGPENPWAEGNARIVRSVATPAEAADFLATSLRLREEM
jgi:predicted Rossmann-fold nucleotide-binding protein